MPPLTLDSPVLDIDPVMAKRRSGFRTKGPPAHEVLADGAFEIRTVGDLVHHYPRRYIDRSRVETIRGAKIGAQVTIIAHVRTVRKRPARNRRTTLVTVTVGDGTGFLDLTFFNQPWTAGLYREGTEVAVSGVATL